MRALPWIIGVAVAAAVLAFAPAAPARAPAGIVRTGAPAPEYMAANAPEMDHGEKNHHSHQHKADHRGGGHEPSGIGEHHHHHHSHPHAADPKHHHP